MELSVGAIWRSLALKTPMSRQNPKQEWQRAINEEEEPDDPEMESDMQQRAREFHQWQPQL